MGTVFNYSFWSKMKRHISSSVVLIFFTILALMCANIQGVKDWYFALWQNPVSLSIGDFNLFSHNGHPLTLGQMINDFLMAIFFLSVGNAWIGDRKICRSLLVFLDCRETQVCQPSCRNHMESICQCVRGVWHRIYSINVYCRSFICWYMCDR